MEREKRRNVILLAGVVFMLLALFSYVSTLDDADPNVLPETAEQVDSSLP